MREWWALVFFGLEVSLGLRVVDPVCIVFIKSSKNHKDQSCNSENYRDQFCKFPT